MYCRVTNISFLRPAFQALKVRENFVIIKVSYSRMAGTREFFLVDSFEQFKKVIRSLQKSDLVEYAELDYYTVLGDIHNKDTCGVIPDMYGKVVLGAY